MKWIFLLRSFLIFAAFFAKSYAQELECGDVAAQMKKAISEVGNEWMGAQLNINEKPRFLVFWSQQDTIKNWVILEKDIRSSLVYCRIAAGTDLQMIKDLHNNKSQLKFGMPGSGNPRCAGSNDGPIPSFSIRLWANKELGDSLIFGLLNSSSNREYVLLMSTDNIGPWILLDQKKNGSTDACYYARGDSSSLRGAK